MKKLILLSSFVLISFLCINAQMKISPSVGIGIAVPTGSFADNVGLGYGASVGADFKIKPHIKPELIASLGYYMFSEKEQEYTNLFKTGGEYGSKTKANTFYIGAGAKYVTLSGFYGAAMLSFHNFTNKVEFNYPDYLPLEDETISEDYTRLGFTPIVGYQFNLAAFKLEVFIRYSIISDYNNFGAGASLKFSL